MHPGPAFHMDAAEARAFAAGRSFAHIFIAGATPAIVHAPVRVTEAGHLRFHLSRRHGAIAGLDGAVAIAGFAGPDAYVSPDWYGLADQVPTWNYLAAEAHGRLRRLTDDEAIAQVDGVTADHEARLFPKAPWTREGMTPGRFDAMMAAIAGYELIVEHWRGTAKFAQDKPVAARRRLAAALDERGEADAARAVAETCR